MVVTGDNLSSLAISDLRDAKALLENPGLAARISNFMGSPLEAGLNNLPVAWHEKITTTVQKSIEIALDVALLTMDRDGSEPPANRWHIFAAGVVGAVGGIFGLPALALELPVSTTIILRSIADIARSEGEDLRLPDAKLQCLQVLALGWKSNGADGVETGYFAVRTALASAVSEAVSHLAQNGLSREGAPAIVKLITQVAARFSIAVSEKAVTQAVPVVGALGGSAINTLFIDHFQDMGRGHFIVRRLERLYGWEEVRRVYEEL